MEMSRFVLIRFVLQNMIGNQNAEVILPLIHLKYYISSYDDSSSQCYYFYVC